MNEYEVQLTNGKRLTLYAFGRADLFPTLEASGFLRSDVANVRLVEKAATHPTEPFLTREPYGDADFAAAAA